MNSTTTGCRSSDPKPHSTNQRSNPHTCCSGQHGRTNRICPTHCHATMFDWLAIRSFRIFGRSKTERVINSPIQPDRISCDVTPYLRIIVPEVVVIQPTLHIKILPRKPQVQDKRLSIAIGIFLRQGTAEGFGIPPPDDLSTFIAGSTGATQVVGVQVIQTSGFQVCIGCPAAQLQNGRPSDHCVNPKRGSPAHPPAWARTRWIWAA